MRSTLGTKTLLFATVLTAPLVPALLPATAHACGCFSSPTQVSSPIVQAGEKILFAKQNNGTVVMQIVVQYSGPATDFGWLLPLPAQPTDSMGNVGIEVGSQEVFDALSQVTQPTYSLTTIPCGGNSGPSFGCAAGSASLGGADVPNADSAGTQTPLVKQSSVGPYNYAILDASNQTAMLNWLSKNNYVVPSGTASVVAPYIRPGAYFLALQLKSGQNAGDLQPVVLRYQSDLPMVPITLTSASATPNMGILIWVLGGARAIPRNYYNTVIDDAQLDWLNQVQNYSSVVANAVRESSGHHGFVTEYSGSGSAQVGSLLGSATRFSFLDTEGLAMQKDPVTFVEEILNPGSTSFGSGFTLNSQLTGLLANYIPMPQALVGSTTPGDYYQNLSFYLNTDRAQNPMKYMDIATALANFNPAALVQDLKTRIVAPTLEAQSLFADPTLSTLTRLYTVMSPDDMNLDPVFSFNADLPPVPKDHSATLHSACPKDGYPDGMLTTDSGWSVDIPGASTNTYPTLSVPYAQRIEQVMDTGMPTIAVDNTDTIQKTLAAAGPGAQGCTSLADGRRHPGPGLMGLMGFGLGLLLLRRRPRRVRQ